MRRGDILAILPQGRNVVLNCVVTHLTVSLYARGVSQLAGCAATHAETEMFKCLAWSVMTCAPIETETSKRFAFELFCDGVGCEFVLLAGEIFGSLGKEAVYFLSDLSEIGDRDGCPSKSAFVTTVR